MDTQVMAEKAVVAAAVAMAAMTVATEAVALAIPLTITMTMTMTIMTKATKTKTLMAMVAAVRVAPVTVIGAPAQKLVAPMAVVDTGAVSLAVMSTPTSLFVLPGCSRCATSHTAGGDSLSLRVVRALWGLAGGEVGTTELWWGGVEWQ